MTRTQLRLVLRLTLTVGVVALVAFAWPNGPRRGAFDAHGTAPGVPGELIVKFRPETTPEQREALLRLGGATVKREMSLPGYYVVSVPEGQERAAGALLARSPAVATVDRSVPREPAAAPNDPRYGQQWHMSVIGLDAARAVSDGAGVTVAVIDTGVAFENYFNPVKNQTFGRATDMSDTLFVDACDASSAVPCACASESDSCQCETGAPPCVNAFRNTHANDDWGHGTHVAATIAQDTDNGYSGAGIAPGASIIPIKVCYRITPASYGCPPADIADGVQYAILQGADVINMSVSGKRADGISAAERDALAAAEAAGIAVVAAAGNYGDNLLGYPAAVPSVISVGAVGLGLTKAGYSSWGHGETGTQLDLVAPGGEPRAEGASSNIWQQTYQTEEGCRGATDYVFFPEISGCYGTSMAAAHVAGVVALLWSAFPQLELSQVREILTCSAQDVGDPGTDLRHGAGLLRADKALEDIDRDGVPDCIDDSVPSPTPSPGPTFPPPPDNCLSPSITPSPSPSPTPEPTPTETPTATPTEAPTESPADTPALTDTPAPTDTPSPEPTQDPMATPTPTPTLTPEPPSPPPPITDTPAPTLFLPGCGDVDCSGFVNALDALGVISWASGSWPVVPCIGLGYVTCDSVLDAADAIAILEYAIGKRNGTSCTHGQ